VKQGVNQNYLFQGFFAISMPTTPPTSRGSEDATSLLKKYRWVFLILFSFRLLRGDSPDFFCGLVRWKEEFTGP